MKKNTKTIVFVVIALLAGYVLGDLIGIPAIETRKTSGDMNTVNNYGQILCPPDYMAFNKSLSQDQTAIDRTVSSMEIISKRIDQYSSMVCFATSLKIDDAEMQAAFTTLTTQAQKDLAARAAARKALAAAQALKRGEKVNLSEALDQAKMAYNAMNNEIKAGKTFVEATDTYLKGKDIKKNLMLATIRDLVASHCAVNASLCQNDGEIDYWYNTDGLVDDDQMALVMAE